MLWRGVPPGQQRGAPRAYPVVAMWRQRVQRQRAQRGMAAARTPLPSPLLLLHTPPVSLHERACACGGGGGARPSQVCQFCVGGESPERPTQQPQPRRVVQSQRRQKRTRAAAHPPAPFLPPAVALPSLSPHVPPAVTHRTPRSPPPPSRFVPLRAARRRVRVRRRPSGGGGGRLRGGQRAAEFEWWRQVCQKVVVPPGFEWQRADGGGGQPSKPLRFPSPPTDPPPLPAAAFLRHACRESTHPPTAGFTPVSPHLHPPPHP